MVRRLLSLLSGWAVERRAAILTISAFIALAFASQLPKLKVDSSPDALVSTVAGQEEIERTFRRHFERSDTQLIVVVEAAKVTDTEALRFQYRVHQALVALEGVRQVDSLTQTPLLPTATGEAPQEPEGPPGVPPERVLAAAKKALRDELSEAGWSEEQLEAVVEGDPNSFEDGVDGLAKRIATFEPAPTLKSDSFTEGEAKSFRQALTGARWLKPVLLSQDETTAAIVVHFDEKKVFDQDTRMDALARVRRAISAVPPADGVGTTLGGVPLLDEAILKKLDKDRLTLNPAMMIICLLILGVTFRWWPAVVAPICAVGIAALVVIGAMALLGQPLTVLTNIIPPLLIIVGLSDSVHLLGRYGEELKIDPDRQVAGRRAARAILIACFLTSLTTAVGFGSLATAQTPELQRFGIAAAAGVVLAYFCTVLFVPAFVTQARPPRAWVSQEGKKPPIGVLERWVFWVSYRVIRHARLVAVLSLLAALGLGYGATQVTADARLLDAFESDDEMTRVTHLIEDKLAGIRSLDVLFVAEKGSLLEPERLHEIEEIERWVGEQAGVISTATYIDPLRELRVLLADDEEARTREFRSLSQTRALSDALAGDGELGATPWITGDEKVARMTIFFEDAGIRRTLEVLDGLEKRLDAGVSKGAVEVSFLGEAYTGSVGRDHVLRDLLSGLGLALVIIFFLLMILFRSPVLAVVAMPPNIIPLLATGAYMMARGIQLNMATVITFSIGIGLAVDDTVHVVARFREEANQISSIRVALLRAARGTGQAIVVTAISLSLGFAVLMMSEFVSVRQFGELIAITVINCLIGALLIQPALLLLVTKREKVTAHGVVTRSLRPPHQR